MIDIAQEIRSWYKEELESRASWHQYEVVNESRIFGCFTTIAILIIVSLATSLSYPLWGLYGCAIVLIECIYDYCRHTIDLEFFFINNKHFKVKLTNHEDKQPHPLASKENAAPNNTSSSAKGTEHRFFARQNTGESASSAPKTENHSPSVTPQNRLGG